jgi:hypothetical protein
MNGLVLVCGLLTPGSDAADPGRAFRPGTGGTNLEVPSDAAVDFDQVQTAAGPAIRLTFGRHALQARSVRFFYRGSFYHVRVGPRGSETRQGPKLGR